MTIRARLKTLVHSILPSADYQRLEGAVSTAWVDLDRQVHQAGPAALTAPWSRAAYRFLMQAERYLAEWVLQQGWVALASAHQAMLLNPADFGRVQRAAILLRREIDSKIRGRRAKAIADLICGEDGELLPALKGAVVPGPEGTPDAKARPVEADRKDVPVDAAALQNRVADALAIRDDQFNTMYFKIALRRRHLFHLFLILWGAITLCLLLTYWNILPEPFKDHHRLVAGVVLFGALGASISVAQTMMTSNISATIPEQQIGAFVVWMRPAVGAAAAVVALLLFHAGEKHGVTAFDMTDTRIALALAFLAGFSERFILGPIAALEGASKSEDGAKAPAKPS